MPTRRTVFTTLALLILGALGGEAAVLIGTPMPWMIGSLTVCAGVAMLIRPHALEGYSFPVPFRTAFVSIIGVMIGAQVKPDLIGYAQSLIWTVLALAVFVALCQAGNYWLFRGLGGYDRPTAFFSAMPGGLIESVLMGEAAGADSRVLIAQQYLRIVIVITALPLGLSLWQGEAVGSAAGLQMAIGGAPGLAPVAIGLAVAVAGVWAARRVGLPAAPITGPMFGAALLTVTGTLPIALPWWLIAAAQVVIGTSLGVRFMGLAPALLRRSFGMALMSVMFMMTLAAGFAAALSAATGIAPLHLLIAFAPGGVAEMALVALSLAANPAIVSLHHVLRILMTVAGMTVAARVMGLRPATPR